MGESMQPTEKLEVSGEIITAKTLAEKFLKKSGWTIAGENDSKADILAEHNGQTILVDVDCVPDTGGLPPLNVDRDRNRELCTKAQWYLAHHGECRSIRVDVIVIAFTGERAATLRHLIGVYEAEL